VDSQQAKQILQLYRPDVDDDDPQFAEALAQAQRDPELRRWLDEQRVLHAAIRDGLKGIRVPAGLLDQILAGHKVVRPPVVWWRSQLARAAAAVIVICLSLYAIVVQLRPSFTVKAPKKDFAAFRDEMTYFAAAGYKLDVQSDSLDELRRQFVQHGWPSDYVVPPGLTRLNVRGGCLMKWHEHKVSMLCLNSAERHGVWLYVVERRALPDAPAQPKPQFAMEGNLATASWSENDKAYLLAAEGNEAFLRTLL
jgi:hypothetical protein